MGREPVAHHITIRKHLQDEYKRSGKFYSSTVMERAPVACSEWGRMELIPLGAIFMCSENPSSMRLWKATLRTGIKMLIMIYVF